MRHGRRRRRVVGRRAGWERPHPRRAILAQPEAVQVRVRAALERRAEAYRGPGGLAPSRLGRHRARPAGEAGRPPARGARDPGTTRPSSPPTPRMQPWTRACPGSAPAPTGPGRSPPTSQAGTRTPGGSWSGWPGSTRMGRRWVERIDGDGVARRQRHYLRPRGGRVERHWIYAAPSAHGAPGLAAACSRPPRAVRRPGAVAARTAARLERLVGQPARPARVLRARPDRQADSPRGRLDRAHQRRSGREALLYTKGGRPMPAASTRGRGGRARGGRLVGGDARRLGPAGRRLARSPAREPRCRSAALMWEEFWGELRLRRQPSRRLACRPAVAERERAGMDLLPKQFEAAWEAFAEAVDGDVADPVLALVDEPVASRPRSSARHDAAPRRPARRAPRLPGRAARALDWGLAARGHPAVDLAWYMGH